MEKYDFILERLKRKFIIAFEVEATHYFSSPGRIEILGNHTDHNNGKVIVSAIDLKLYAAVRINNSNFIRVSYNEDDFVVIDVNDLRYKKEEELQSIAMIRGVMNGLISRGYLVKGFDVKIDSMIPQGSGISSSAAFELVFTEICNNLFNYNQISCLEKAIISQEAEINYFRKPCGLLDQIGISYGAINHVDFIDVDNPVITPINNFFTNYQFVLVNTLSSHSTLTKYYSEIKEDMNNIASHFGAENLRQIAESDFYNDIPALFKNCGGRAILRAMHYFEENKRVDRALKAFNEDDVEMFLKIVNSSGNSSYSLLQNCYYSSDNFQGLALGINVSKHILKRGAVRVHGGGFAGTLLAIVHDDDVNEYISKIASIFGSKNIYLVKPNMQGTKEIKY